MTSATCSRRTITLNWARPSSDPMCAKRCTGSSAITGYSSCSTAALTRTRTRTDASAIGQAPTTRPASNSAKAGIKPLSTPLTRPFPWSNSRRSFAGYSRGHPMPSTCWAGANRTAEEKRRRRFPGVQTGAAPCAGGPKRPSDPAPRPRSAVPRVLAGPGKRIVGDLLPSGRPDQPMGTAGEDLDLGQGPGPAMPPIGRPHRRELHRPILVAADKEQGRAPRVREIDPVADAKRDVEINPAGRGHDFAVIDRSLFTGRRKLHEAPGEMAQAHPRGSTPGLPGQEHGQCRPDGRKTRKYSAGWRGVDGHAGRAQAPIQQELHEQAPE